VAHRGFATTIPSKGNFINPPLAYSSPSGSAPGSRLKNPPSTRTLLAFGTVASTVFSGSGSFIPLETATKTAPASVFGRPKEPNRACTIDCSKTLVSDHSGCSARTVARMKSNLQSCDVIRLLLCRLDKRLEMAQQRVSGGQHRVAGCADQVDGEPQLVNRLNRCGFIPKIV
jgi:hypothetical protein